jgi:FkbM family methyltransferase
MTADNQSGRSDALVRRLIGVYDSLPLRPLKHQLGKLFRAYASGRTNRTVQTTIEGITYQLDLNETIDSTLFYRGSWEPDATATMRQLIQPGMTVFDVGANVGYFTLLFARLVGETGTIVAFEPTTWAIRKLRRNMSLNDFRNIVAEQLALSDTAGEVETSSMQTAFRASWPLTDSRERAPEAVTLLPLDSYVRRANIERVDFIKVDVDGYEHRVVQGAAETLRAHQPHMMLEIGREAMSELGDRSEDLVELLSSLGYSFLTEDRQRAFADGDEMLNWIPSQGANIYCRPIRQRGRTDSS